MQRSDFLHATERQSKGCLLSYSENIFAALLNLTTYLRFFIIEGLGRKAVSKLRGFQRAAGW